MDPRILAGRYELTQRIGSGGMGTVWRATDILLQRQVAVKLLHESLAHDAAFTERFRREARHAASLSHPNIVAVYDSGEDDAVPFIVMELVDGESLHARLHRDGPMTVRDAVAVSRSALAALGHAHARGLIHRDFKTANVLLSRDGHTKVVDFGIAKGLGDASVTRTGAMMGTAAYISPEQALGHDATPSSDLYALGCLIFAVLTGHPPFEGDSPVAVAMRHTRDPVPSLRARRPDVPAGIENVVMHALEKDPARRFRSAAEMDAALVASGIDNLSSSAPTLVAAAASTTLPIRGTEVLTRTRSRPAQTRSGRVLGMIAAALLAAAVLWLLVAYFANRGPSFLQAPIPTDTTAPTPVSTLAPTPAPSVATPEPPILDLPGIKVTEPKTPAPAAQATPQATVVIIDTTPPTSSPPGDTATPTPLI